MKHVVFGTGPVGSALARELSGRGEQVVAVNRSGRADVGGATVLAGDANDADFVRLVADGSAVVYQCLNPPYTKWPDLFPPLQRNLIDAAKAAGAKLVSFENLYAYGPTRGAPLTEDLPFDATGRKGKVRGAMSRELLALHAAGELRVTMGRASDYFGPGGLVTHMGERVFYPILAGKKAQVFGNPDLLHTFSYIPDIATGLATLGTDDRADGQAWHLPNAKTLSTRDLIGRVADAAGTEGGVSPMPGFLVNLMALFNGNVREIKEVLFEFREPFIVDSSKFDSTFGQSATPLTQSIPTTVEWFRHHPKG